MQGSPPLNQFPSEPAVKRSKFLWRFFLMSNFAICAYIFAHSGKRERGKEKEKGEAPAEVTTSTPAAEAAPPQEEPVVSPPIEGMKWNG